MEWTRTNEEGDIEFTDDARLIPEVQAILTLSYNKAPGDMDGRKRNRAKTEAKYLRLVYSVKSPYRDYSKDERLAEAKFDCKFPNEWEESTELKLLVPKFIKGDQSKTARLLTKVENFLEKFEKHLDGIDLNERSSSGGMVHDPGKIMTTLRQLPAMAQTIQELEQQVKLGLVGNPKSKGDHEIGWMMGNESKQQIDETTED